MSCVVCLILYILYIITFWNWNLTFILSNTWISMELLGMYLITSIQGYKDTQYIDFKLMFLVEDKQSEYTVIWTEMR